MIIDNCRICEQMRAAQRLIIAHFYRFNENGTLQAVGICTLPTGHLSDIKNVPEDADLFTTSACGNPHYIAGQYFSWRRLGEVPPKVRSQIPKEILAVFNTRNGHQWVYVTLDQPAYHVELTEEGALDLCSLVKVL